MEHVDQQTWDALFEGLRARYLENLPDRLAALEASLQEIKSETGDGTGAGETISDLRESLTMQAHQMVGSGKTYGFDTISSQARRLEERLLNPSNSIAEAVEPADALIDECRKIISVGRAV